MAMTPPLLLLVSLLLALVSTSAFLSTTTCGFPSVRTGRSTTSMAAGASPPPCVTSLQERLAKEDILFQDTMDAVDEGYVYEPKPFVNAGVVNEAGTNAASCKIFSMGKLASFSKEETLKCFGEVYRGVLDTPEGSDHGNIRNFMAQSWEGMEFPEGVCLTEKA